MIEHPCQFGPELNLVGVLTEGDPATRRSDAPVAVFLNAGFLHRVGPQRLSVTLARRLATAGFDTFRFDLGGRGDSAVSDSSADDEQRVLADIGFALDYLERRLGARRVVLIGLCAGADNAHAVMVRDSRVVGAVMLDGVGFRTPGYYLAHYLPRLFRARVWANLVRRALRDKAPAAAAGDYGMHGERRPFAAREVVQAEIQACVHRGVRLLYVYTGGVDYYNYRSQFDDMFRGLDRQGRVAVEHYPAADHIYLFPEDRNRMVDRVADWFSSQPWSGA